MPQVWLTYEELEEAFALDPLAARADVVDQRWSRRSCSDGQIRIKLPAAAAHEFMLAYAQGHMRRALANQISGSVLQLQDQVVRLQDDLSASQPTEAESSSGEAARGEMLPSDAKRTAA
jgi:outer membrane murein-binding lipoprotein Lpp